ncbi:MAG: TolC family protein [Candidatus Eremiobacteraeota bacterium]|nr:TolC family protein [Candidatus Eremiobacteraeota bacterium]
MRLVFGAGTFALASMVALTAVPIGSVSARATATASPSSATSGVPAIASPSSGLNNASAAPAAGPSAVPSAGSSGAPQTAPTVIGIPNNGAATGKALNAGQPTPYPLNTLAPLGSGTPLPFPAYGTPVPGVGIGVVRSDVPATINLQQAIAIGFARSPLLAIARGDVAVQAAAVRLERAGLLPSFSGSAALTYTHDQNGGGGSLIDTGAGTTTGTTGTTTTTAIAGGGPYSSTNASFALSLAQLIYDGGKIAASVDAAKSTESATVDNYKRELQTVAYNVANSYYAYLGAQRLTQVDLEIVREDIVQENLVRAQVRAGTSAQADIATTQLPTAQARLAVVRAQGAQYSAEAAFVNAMGLEANSNVQPVDDAPVFTTAAVSGIPIPSYDTALQRALALRPDYDAQVQTVSASRYSLRAAQLGLFPTLSASASASDASEAQNLNGFRNNQSIGLSLSLPIYDQGITAANTASARAQLDISNSNLQNTALGVQLNVKQALTNLVAARAAVDETQQEYATAVVNVQSTQAQYRAGVTTLPLLLNAQVQLTQALVDQVSSVYTLRENEQAYLYAEGSNYDATQFTLPRVSKRATGTTTAHAPRTLLQRLQSAIH